MQSLARWFPFLNWPKPTAALLRGEFWAGLTVGLMLLPQGVAYAALAGMPLITGIYASIIPAAVAILFSPSPRLGVGHPQLVRDLPAGGGRFLQKGEGYLGTWVAGRCVQRDGELTAARTSAPGRAGR